MGAGPGDLGLVTLRAKECIEQAEVIVYDYLSNAEMLKWAPAAAEIIFVGKKAGAHTLTQDKINALLVEKAQAGKRVVRLKGGRSVRVRAGGRGSPGAGGRSGAIRSCSGSYFGHGRTGVCGNSGHPSRKNSHVTIFTGHEDPAKCGSAIDFPALAQLGGTQVMLMGVERIEAIAQKMLAQRDAQRSSGGAHSLGHDRATGDAGRGIWAISRKRVAEKDFAAPAVAVFGDVVSLRDELNWFEQRPLFGKRIVVTRSRSQAGVLSEQLRDLGADVIEIPDDPNRAAE